MFVYIINQHGQPLMPCQPRKARLLLKSGKAKVITMVPLTLQLLYGSSGYMQDVSLGIDAGTHHIGVSATTEKAVLFEAEVKPRGDIQEVLATRRQFRNARRQRKTRYRQARFLNRKRPEGWYVLKLVRRNNRQLHKATIRKGGKRQRNTAPKKVYGFRLFDCVRYQGTTCFVFGRRSSGYFDLRALDGTKISPSARYNKLKVVQRASACLVERKAAFPPTPKGWWVSTP